MLVNTTERLQPHADNCSTASRSLQTGIVDMDALEEKALEFRPKMIICGASAYPRDWDYKRFREIADKVGAYLIVDMAHIRWEQRAAPWQIGGFRAWAWWMVLRRGVC